MFSMKQNKLLRVPCALISTTLTVQGSFLDLENECRISDIVVLYRITAADYEVIIITTTVPQ